jgi:hypothetical protein
MQFGKGDDRQLDGSPSDQLLWLQIVKQARQGLSSETWQQERPIGFDPNCGPAKTVVNPAFPFVPIPLWENTHAGIQDPDDRIADPDQDRGVEEP